MRRILRKIEENEFGALGDTSTLARSGGGRRSDQESLEPITAGADETGFVGATGRVVSEKIDAVVEVGARLSAAQVLGNLGNLENFQDVCRISAHRNPASARGIRNAPQMATTSEGTDDCDR